MTINIKGTNIDLTDGLRSYIMEKFGTLERYFPDVPTDGMVAHIEIGRPSAHHRKGEVYVCDITLEVAGTVLRAEDTGETPYAAIDIVQGDIERQVRTMKAKKRDKFLRRARKGAREMKLWRIFRKDE